MERVAGEDAVFLLRETAAAPQHLSTLQIYDPSTAPGGKVSYSDLLAHIDSRLHLFPRSRQKLVHVPMSLDLPYWLEDGEFDLEFHVRHLALPEPGDWHQLCMLVSRLHSRPLDINRPLWEMYVIEGLSNVSGLPKGSFAILTKVHTSALGEERRRRSKASRFRPLQDAILDDSPEPANLAPNKPWLPEDPPLTVELLGRAWLHNITQPFKIMRMVGETVPDIAKLVSRVRQGTWRRNRAVPRTRFNVQISPHRVIDGAAFDLKTLSEIKNVVDGATVNDVVLSICGGAMRKYLRAKAELPRQPMLALTPVKIAALGGRIEVAPMAVTLATNVEDALDRLEAVRDATRSSGRLDRAIAAHIMTDFTHHAPAMTAALGSRAMAGLGFVNRVNPLFNCTVANVPGPQVPLYLCGARLVAIHGIGALSDGAGISFSAKSYAGELTITLVADRKMVPDPDFLAECLEQSFADLKRASAGRRRRRQATLTVASA